MTTTTILYLFDDDDDTPTDGVAEWQGLRVQGRSHYSIEEYDTLVAWAKTNIGTRAEAMTFKAIVARWTELGPNAVRNILTEADGREFVTARRASDQAIFLAETLEESERFTDRLKKIRDSITTRLVRRATMANILPVEQGALFE